MEENDFISEKILESLVGLEQGLQELQTGVSDLKETLTEIRIFLNKSAELIQNKPKILTTGFESERIQDVRQMAGVVKKTTIPFQDSALITLQKLSRYLESYSVKPTRYSSYEVETFKPKKIRTERKVTTFNNLEEFGIVKDLNIILLKLRNR